MGTIQIYGYGNCGYEVTSVISFSTPDLNGLDLIVQQKGKTKEEYMNGLFRL